MHTQEIDSFGKIRINFKISRAAAKNPKLVEEAKEKAMKRFGIQMATKETEKFREKLHIKMTSEEILKAIHAGRR